MKDYYLIQAEDFNKYSKIEFKFVKTYAEMCEVFARELVDLIQANTSVGNMTKVILPVGPLDLSVFAKLCNQEGVSCESLVIFAMDEHCTDDGKQVPIDHPLSFRGYFQRSLLDLLDDDKRIPEDQLILPDPEDLDNIPQKIDFYEGVDVTYGGFGINGHIAFNSPPREPMDLEEFKQTITRAIELRESDITQMAMGGTWGNIEVIPTKACTLGISELLSAEEIHMVFFRSWHAGVLRRALFGPVTSEFPGSLVQTHPKVRATITAEAARLPAFSLLQGAGR